MDKLIPEITSVQEVRSRYGSDVTFVCLDTHAGKPNRYTVIRLFYQTGITRVIGRELPMDLARIVASRLEEEDGAPIRVRGDHG